MLGEIGVRSCILAYSGTTDQPAHIGVMQADMVGDFLLRVSVLSLSNAKIKDMTLLFRIREMAGPSGLPLFAGV